MADITKEQVTVTINGIKIDEKTYEYIFKLGYKLGCEERKQGEWILSRKGIYTCSICGLDAPAGEVNHQGYEYCPKCGNRLER